MFLWIWIFDWLSNHRCSETSWSCHVLVPLCHFLYLSFIHTHSIDTFIFMPTIRTGQLNCTINLKSKLYMLLSKIHVWSLPIFLLWGTVFLSFLLIVPRVCTYPSLASVTFSNFDISYKTISYFLCKKKSINILNDAKCYCRVDLSRGITHGETQFHTVPFRRFLHFIF